jgi:hypothetical protein
MAADNNQLHPFTQMIREGPHFPLAYLFPGFCGIDRSMVLRKLLLPPTAQTLSLNGTSARLNGTSPGYS